MPPSRRARSQQERRAREAAAEEPAAEQPVMNAEQHDDVDLSTVSDTRVSFDVAGFGSLDVITYSFSPTSGGRQKP